LVKLYFINITTDLARKFSCHLQPTPSRLPYQNNT